MEGGVKEMTKTFHNESYNTLHTNTGKLPSLINRSEFGGWRRSYWIWRGTNF